MNKKILLGIILGINICFIVAIILFNNGKSYNSLVINSDKWNELLKNKMESSNIKIKNIKFNDYSLLIDEIENKIVYSMKDGSGKYNPSIKYELSDNLKIVINEEITEERVKDNYNFKLMIYDDTKYHIYDLIVTSLPIMNISFDEDEILNKNRIKANMYLFDNRNNSHKNVINSDILLNIIDNESDKKDYSFSMFFDSLGKNKRENNISVLGMQKHSEYLLNSMSNDDEKIREVFSTNLWNNISTSKNDNSDYIELYINNHYVGLYSLGFNTEKESLMLDKEEFLFFKNEFVNSEEKYNINDKMEGYKLYNDVLQKQVKENSLRRECKNCPKNDGFDELNKYYKNLLSKDIEKIKMVSNLDNAVDIYLYYLFIQADNNVNDETFNNTYLVLRKNRDGYISEYIPWNVKYTFGNTLNKEKVVDASNNNYVMKYNPITLLLELNDENIKRIIKDRYSNLRANELSVDFINKLVDNYESKIFSSGAYLRDRQKWNKENINNDNKSSVFRDYILERIKYMDEYINNL